MANRRYVTDLTAKLRFLGSNTRMRRKHGFSMRALSKACGQKDGWLKSAVSRGVDTIDSEVEAKLAELCGFDFSWPEWREGTLAGFEARLFPDLPAHATTQIPHSQSGDETDPPTSSAPQRKPGAVVRPGGEEPVLKRPPPMMAPTPPKDFVPRPAEFDALKKQILSSDTKGTVAITAALRGAGGYGKTTLASALAHDDDIRRAYSDGVLWVELGERGGSRVVPFIADLVHLLGDEPRAIQTREGARTELAAALGNRRILLIIDDVWERADLEPFLHGGLKTTRLITTRFDKELPEDSVRQPVDAMRDNEARVLLARGLPPDQVRSHRAELDALARMLHEWAQLLKLANGFLRDRVVKFRQPLAAAITEAEKRLHARGLPAFGTPEARGEEGRHKSFAAAMGINVDLLDAHQRAQLDMLAVFPEDVDIPVGIVARLWAHGGTPDEFSTLDRLTEFFNLSLLLALDLDRRVIRFHDTTRHYLQDEAKKRGSVAGLHLRLVEAMEGLNTSVAGASGGEVDYYFRHLPTHLDEAGEREKLDALLLDPGWLQTKLAATGSPTALVVDYNQFGRSEMHSLICRTLLLTSGICARDQRQLLPQMLGRLMACTDPSAPAFLAKAKSLLWLPALVPQRPGLTPPGAETARFEGHAGGVTALVVLPDGRLTSGSYDRTIRVWDTASGAETARLAGHRGWVMALAVLPDGRLASGSDDRTIRLWDTASGAETARFEGHAAGVTALAVLPDGRLASGPNDRTIRLWDTARGTETARFEGYGGRVTALSVMPDGRLASGSYDGTIRLLDAGNGAEAARFAGSGYAVRALAGLPDGRLASGTNDGTIRVWDEASGAGTARLASSGYAVRALAVLPDGRLASGDTNGTIRLWDAGDGAETARLAGHGGWVSALAVLPNGRLASGANDGAIRLWDAGSEVEPARFDGRGDRDWSLAGLPDGRLASDTNDGTIRVWEAGSGAKTAPLASSGYAVRALAVLPDGRLASGASDGTVRLWEAGSGAETLRFGGHARGVTALAVLPDGRLASGSDDRTIRLWDAAKGVETGRLEGHAGGVAALAVLPDGRLASGADDMTIRLLDTATGKEITHLDVDAPVVCLVALDDGRLVAGDAQGRLLWVKVVE